MALSRTSITASYLESVALFNRESQAYLRGKAPYPRKRRNEWIIGLLNCFLVIGLLFIGIALKNWYDYALLGAEGIAGMATINDKHIHAHDDAVNYFITMTYTVAGDTYLSEAVISPERYESLTTGDLIAIIYAQSQPSIVTVDEARLDKPIGTSIVALILNLVIVGLFYAVLGDEWRAKHFAQAGTLLGGEVVACEGEIVLAEIYTLELRYRFLSPTTHQWIAGKASTIRNDLKPVQPEKRALIFEVGTPLLIAYLDDNRHQPL